MNSEDVLQTVNQLCQSWISDSPLFRGCIDEEIELMHNTSLEFSAQQIAVRALNNLKLLVSHALPNQNLVFRGVNLNHYLKRRQELLSEADRIMNLLKL